MNRRFTASFVAMTTLTSGCYRYAPIGDATPEAGAEVRLALGSGATPELFGPQPVPSTQGVSTPVPARARRGRLDASDLRRALERAGGDRRIAAQILGISRTTLWRRLAALERAGEPSSD